MIGWTADAACVGHDPRLWDPTPHPKHVGELTRARWAEAVHICGQCPVRVSCEEAVTGEDVGTVRAGRVVDGRGRLVSVQVASRVRR